jgi:endoglucanase
VIIDSHGAIIRGDTSVKEIALVFTGDTFADGGEIIRKALNENHVKASFFLTGNFYTSKSFRPLIRNLIKDGNYLGAHSDKHLLYADWKKRDSSLISKKQFVDDLEANYRRMEPFHISKEEAFYFLPPYEWYNSTVAGWTTSMGLRLVNYTPGTLAAADYSYPVMGDRYRSSETIYKSIVEFEDSQPNGLNGFILLLHIGTDPRRTDKFYSKLGDLITHFKDRGYRFVTIKELLD